MAAQTVQPRFSPPVEAALLDDLNLPQVLSELHAIRKRIEVPGQGEAANELGQNLAALGLDPNEFFAFERNRLRLLLGEDPDAKQNRIYGLIAARLEARRQKNFAEADRIRGELDAMGISLKDAKDPATGEIVTTWEVKR